MARTNMVLSGWLGALILVVHAFPVLSSRSLQTTMPSIVQCTKVDNADFWGGDIVKLGNIPSFQACCKHCSKNPNCDRWTYVAATKRCSLKRSSGWMRKSSTGSVSGRVIRDNGSTGTSPTTPSPSFPTPTPTPTTATPTLAPIPSNGAFSKQNYMDVLGLSWMFYEAQRSGVLPPHYRIHWRKSAHTTDVVPGGWYDAGDYLKLNFPLASTVSILSWGIDEFKDGYIQSGQLQQALDNLYAAADYLKRSHIAPRKYVGQIGNPDVDHNFWGRADQEKGARPAYVYDSTMGAADLLGKVAAALASSSIVFRDVNATVSAGFLDTAIQLYAWGTQSPGKYSNYYTSATASIYPSTDWEDDMAWGAYWLYRATNDNKYLHESVAYWKKKQWDVTSDWDNSGAAVAIGLANLIEDGVSVPLGGQEAKTWVTDTFLAQWTKPSGEIVSTPKGLHYPKWSKWGNLQLSTTASFLALIHAKHSKSASLRKESMKFARSQIDYTLGSGGRSFVVGYGNVFPLQPHHAGASCPNRPAQCDWANYDSPRPNPQILYGAVVGGPEGPGDNSYRDKRSDYVSNEVACDYNSGFTGALAGLVQMVA